MADELTWKMVAQRLDAMGRGAKNKLAKKLEIDASDLSRRLKRNGEPTASQAKAIEAFLSGDSSGAPATEPVRAATRRLPVFGYAAAGGEDYVALASDAMLDEIELPAGLVRGEAFVVRTRGESMYPRLRSAEPMVVETQIAPAREDAVLVQLKNGSGLVKEYRGQKDGYLFLWQYNPEKEIRIPLIEVANISFAWPWRRH
ncbi:MAG TPA: S24 family peptidase [Phenylobacterium sp.]|nr:S24 family peptidase [Phenylobacterium sp.]